MKLLAIDDLNVGEEIAYSLNSARWRDPEAVSSLSQFINQQMNRILLSKMNSEVSNLYTAGFDRDPASNKKKRLEKKVEQIRESMDVEPLQQPSSPKKRGSMLVMD